MKLAGQSGKTTRTASIQPEPAALARSLLKCQSFAKNGSKERSPVRRGIGYQVSGGPGNYHQGGKSNRAFLLRKLTDRYTFLLALLTNLRKLAAVR
jgi:hypothetical protein